MLLLWLLVKDEVARYGPKVRRDLSKKLSSERSANHWPCCGVVVQNEIKKVRKKLCEGHTYAASSKVSSNIY